MIAYRIVRKPTKGFVVERQTATRPCEPVQTCATYEIARAVRNALINTDRLAGRDAYAWTDVI